MKLDKEPRIEAGGNFMFSLKAWMRRVAQAVNGLVDTKANTDSPALTGTPTAPTPSTADDSTRIATTGWVRSAMSSIASAAGFVLSSGATSAYVKFPSWLGGLIIQAGFYNFGSLAASASSGTYYYTLPAAFPNRHWATAIMTSDRAMFTGGGPNTLTQWYASFQNNWGGGALNMSGSFISIGY